MDEMNEIVNDLEEDDDENSYDQGRENFATASSYIACRFIKCEEYVKSSLSKDLSCILRPMVDRAIHNTTYGIYYALTSHTGKEPSENVSKDLFAVSHDISIDMERDIRKSIRDLKKIALSSENFELEIFSELEYLSQMAFDKSTDLLLYRIKEDEVCKEFSLLVEFNSIFDPPFPDTDEE